MAKTITTLLQPIPDSYIVVSVHWGADGAWSPDAVHAVWAYQALRVPPGVGPYHWKNSLEDAILEAKAWVGLPQLVKDICPSCRLMTNGPHVPRWNIYRGANQVPVPRCVLWDSWLGEPVI